MPSSAQKRDEGEGSGRMGGSAHFVPGAAASLSGADLEAARGAARRGRPALLPDDDAPDGYDTAGGRSGPFDGDLTASLFGHLFRLVPRLMELQEIGVREYGLGFARGRVLWALRESGPVLMRALSEALQISPRTVTGLVDALEADGWVTRSPHPTDRRATIISLTPAAAATMARLSDSYQELAYELLGDVPPAELAAFRDVIITLEERLDDAVARALRAAGGPQPG
jgi:DNA-binding MarR family transcriptional regulator